MDMKKIQKITSIVLVVLLLTMFVSTICFQVFALDPSGITINNNPTGSDQIKNVGGTVIGILQTVGVVLSIAILVVLGIKYMMGSSEEKAEYKKSMMPYIIGAALIFAASALAQVVYQFFTNVSA